MNRVARLILTLKAKGIWSEKQQGILVYMGTIEPWRKVRLEQKNHACSDQEVGGSVALG